MFINLIGKLGEEGGGGVEGEKKRWVLGGVREGWDEMGYVCFITYLW